MSGGGISAQAAEARRILSEGLGSLQQLPRSRSLDSAIEGIASASSELYVIETGTPAAEEAFEGIRTAIALLGEALPILRSLGSASDHTVLVATEAVARTLALLYPVARVQQRARRMVIDPSQGLTTSNMPESGEDPESSLPVAAVPKAPKPLGRRRSTPVYEGREHRQRGNRVFIEADIGMLSDTNFYTGLSHDISDGGVFVATYQVQAPGTRVTLYFALPDGHVVHAGGVVRWVRGASADGHAGMGVAFEDLSPIDMAAIQRFIDQRSPILHAEASGTAPPKK